MCNKKKLVGRILLFTFCCTSVLACKEEAKETFESWTVSDDGVLNWNDVKEAKYYYCSFSGVESSIWTDKSEINIKDYFGDKCEIKQFEIKAYISKTELGRMHIDPLKDQIVCSGSKFYKYDDAPRYKLTIKCPNRKTKTKFYENVLQTNLTKYKADVDLIYNDVVSYEFIGFYYDSSYQNALNEDIILDKDITIYSYLKEFRKNISFSYRIGDGEFNTTTEFYSRDLNYTGALSLESIELPTVEGASFSHWKGFENKPLAEVNQYIPCTVADDEYTAVYYKDVELVFINKPFARSITGSNTKEDHPEYVEYGKCSAAYKGLVYSDTLLNYFHERFSHYYISTSYCYSNSYSEFLKESAEEFSNYYENHNGATLYIWGEN